MSETSKMKKTPLATKVNTSITASRIGVEMKTSIIFSIYMVQLYTSPFFFTKNILCIFYISQFRAYFNIFITHIHVSI